MADAFYERDDTKLIDGPARWLYTPYATTAPANAEDVVAMVDPYAAKTNWVDGGHTLEGVTVSREISKEGYETEQSGGQIRSRLTGTERQLTVQSAEIRPDIVRLWEEGSDDVAIAAGANKGAQTAVDVGVITALSKFRIAVFALRDKDDVPVIEPGSADVARGGIYGYLCFRAELAAESAELVLAKGELSNIPLTFDLFPDSANGNKTMRHLFETAGTIAAV